MNRPAITSVATSRRLVLSDGRCVGVRTLESKDREGLQAATERLSSRSRYLRFASPKPRLSPKELDLLTDLDHHGREALVAIDPDSRRGVATARYGEMFDEPGVVDVAVTVDDAWQGRGLGGALLLQVLARAREEGHSFARATVLAENSASRAMLRRAGFVPRGSDGPLIDLELDLRNR